MNLRELDMTMMAGLITDEGLDAAGEYDLQETSIFGSFYAKRMIPAILDEYNGEVPNSVQRKIQIESFNKAQAELESMGSKTGALQGILLRSRFVDKKLAIVLAPVDKDAVQKIKSMEAYSAAILLLEMATHELKGASIVRADLKKFKNIIEDLKDLMEIKARRANRRS